MEYEKKLWEQIFHIHQYFYSSGFRLSFIEDYYNHLRDLFCNTGLRPGLYELYDSITNKKIPPLTKLSEFDCQNIDYFIIDDLDLDSISPFHTSVILNI